jgi:type VI protein secretion system component Hcp
MGIFLKLDGIDSDATDKNHPGWIACDSFSGGTMRPMFLETGGGMQRETSSADFHEIGVRMKMHKGSPKVFLASLLGDAKKATIHITRAGDTSGALNYLEVILTDTYVTRYSVDHTGDNTTPPFESISLNFTKIEQKYLPGKSGGKTGSPVPVGYDMATGKKL